ncbi:SRPBCC family protein [Streptomyces sp. NPDC048290]|uniref:SRPBCC family protein n=1 Tax=Streptomyces sp. NPDC048290 TaxID=3155811 RepID=UPI003432E19B
MNAAPGQRPENPHSVQLATRIARSAADVYAFASAPSHIPLWAAGLGRAVEDVDGRWIADSPMGRVEVVFVPLNDFGVLDHDVTLPSGEVVHNPVRVIADGPDAAEVVFTLRRREGMTEEEFRRDEAAVRRDLGVLKRVLEEGEDRGVRGEQGDGGVSGVS